MARLLRALHSTRGLRLLTALITVVLLAVVASEAYLLATPEELPEAPATSRDVARDFAVAVASFDFRQIEADIERVRAFGAPGFLDEFGAAMGDDFVTEIVAARRISVGEITAGPMTQRVRDDSAVFLVIVTQRVATLDEDDIPGQPQLVRIPMLVTTETDDEPLVLAVEVL